ncbi:MAG TPA: peptidoglycan DD-metalloendopeptidase family protein, partial [Fibrobacteria bacterium]|nr:peptidoglycan DD-metalloendopeptidase family protein [Fibrobacteria bacterium]
LEVAMNPKKTASGSPCRTARPGVIPALILSGALAFLAGCRNDKAARADAPPQVPQVSYDTLSGRIKVGESFNSMARDLGLPESESSQLLAGIKDNFRFKLYAGQSYRVIFRVTVTGRELHSFVLEDRFSERRHVLSRPEVPAGPVPADAQGLSAASAPALAPGASLPAAGFAYAVVDIPVRTDTVAVNGALSSNLYDAFVSRGETGALIQQVTRIFAWDLDFFKDPRSGDEFSLLVEKKFGEDGAFRGYGRVLSAKYVNRGKEYYGILYKGSYFGQDGRSMEKMLMKAPLNFVRVSSGFSAARLHPVLGVTRPHWGIDYAGPKGTKILAAGDGTVEYSKWVNGYGKTIKIRHNGVYNTYYAHLNGFASGIGCGRRVKQGEVIGFMGMTGLATGVHLDYRVEFNGKYINPASLRMESKQGVDKPEWKDFCDHRDLLLARMSTSEFRHFASVTRPTEPGAARAF